jgi:hypothetical protein
MRSWSYFGPKRDNPRHKSDVGEIVGVVIPSCEDGCQRPSQRLKLDQITTEGA